MKKANLIAFLLYVSAILFAQEYDSSIFDAIEKNDMGSLKKIVTEDNYKWFENDERENLLMYAVRISNLDAVISLLPYYAEVTIINDQNNSRKNILELADSQQNVEIKRLIVNKVYQELNDLHNFDTLYMLIFTGNDSVRQGITAGKINVNVKNKQGSSLLHYSASNKSFSNRGFSSNYFSDEKNKLALAQFLVQEHININAIDSYGETALLKAIKNDYSQLASLCIDSKASLDNGDNESNTPLWKALSRGNIEIFTKLIFSGAKLDLLDDNGNSLLAQCIDDKKFNYAKILITAGADVNAKKKNGRTPLYEACDENNLEIAKLLIEKGANVNSKNGSYDKPPLFEVMYPDNYELVQLLIEKGANANGKDKSGENALFHINSSFDQRIIKLLLDHGADVNARNDKGETPVLNAACFGRFDQLNLYKSYNAHFNVMDNEENTGIHYSVLGAVPTTYEIMHKIFYTGHTITEDILNIFFDHGVDINRQNKKGQTALMLAANGKEDYPEYVRLILSYQVNINLQDTDNRTALMYAVGKPQTVQALLDAHPNLTLMNSDGNTALDIAEKISLSYPELTEYEKSAHILRAALGNNTPLKPLTEAILLGYTDQLSAILAQNRDINETDSEGSTALFCAVVKQDIQTLRLLINLKANPNIAPKNWLPPLSLAIKKRDNEISRMLITAGADVQKTAYDGYSIQTPLRIAIGDPWLYQEPNLEAVQFLIQAGADIEWKNGNGETELVYACRNSSPEIVQYLLDCNASIFVKVKYDFSSKMIFELALEINKPLIQAKLDSLFIGKTMRADVFLNLRTDQNFRSDKLIKLSKGSTVRILQTGAIEEYEKIISCWVEVSTEKGATDTHGKSIPIGTKGWAFAGFLK